MLFANNAKNSMASDSKVCPENLLGEFKNLKKSNSRREWGVGVGVGDWGLETGERSGELGWVLGTGDRGLETSWTLELK